MTNCAMMGVDWRDLTWWQYTAVLAVWNGRHDAQKRPLDRDFSRLERAMKAHETVQ